jgi:Alanine dehydrogenase/PNT, C-terminal domain
VAGLASIGTARSMGAVVSAYDVRPVVREQVREGEEGVVVVCRRLSYVLLIYLMCCGVSHITIPFYT